VVVGAGGRGVTVRAAGAAACLVVRFGRGLGAVTVTGGSGVCGFASGGIGGAGVVCGGCGAGVGVGAGSGVVCGGGSGVVGDVCDAATPAREINTSAEPLKSNKQLVRIVISAPIMLPKSSTPEFRFAIVVVRGTATSRPAYRCCPRAPGCVRPDACTWSVDTNRSMSGDGRCAGAGKAAMQFA
jgi:hypothetical protein